MENRYEIRGEIGQGGVGVVYEAWDRQLARLVALKRLLPLEGEEEKKRDENRSSVNDLLREASILSSMQHPNIVSVFDAGVDEMGPYVVMELIEGEVLRDAVDRGPLIEGDFMEVVEQTLDALVSAHHHGLLHRDIKPRNLMFRWLPSDKFQVKLLDFGLAKFSPAPSKQTQAFKDTIMGSCAYMAPEQFEHEFLDHRTDLYQLGCVFYFALTGTLPFDGESPADVMDSHLQHRVTPLGELRSDLRPGVAEWVMKLIAREPDDRFASAKNALESFRECLRTQASNEDDDTEPVPIQAKPSVETSAKAKSEVSFMLPEDEADSGIGKPLMWGCVGLCLTALAIYLFSQYGPEASPPFEEEEPKIVVLEDDAPPLESANEDPFASNPDVPIFDVQDHDAIAAQLGKAATVKGLVVRTGQSQRGTSFLNFESPHFTVVSFASDRAFFRLDPSMLYENKFIEITGTIDQYEDQYQIKLAHPDQVKVVESQKP